MNWYGIEFTVEFFVLFAIFGSLAAIFYGFEHPGRVRLLVRLQMRKLRRQDGLFNTGLLLTALIVGLIFFFFGFDYCALPDTCKSKAVALISSSPNEFGDTLAGVAGTLAFLWIILTVMMQSKELRAQRLELKLTREEFRLQRIISEKQIDILRDEQQFRREQRVGSEFDSLLAEFRRSIEWHGKNKNLCKGIWGDVVSKSTDYEDNIDFFLELFFAIRDTDISSNNFQSLLEKSGYVRWSDLTSPAEEICEIEPKLSSADRIRFEGARIKRIKKYLEEFADEFSNEQPKGENKK